MVSRPPRYDRFGNPPYSFFSLREARKTAFLLYHISCGLSIAAGEDAARSKLPQHQVGLPGVEPKFDALYLRMGGVAPADAVTQGGAAAVAVDHAQPVYAPGRVGRPAG